MRNTLVFLVAVAACGGGGHHSADVDSSPAGDTASTSADGNAADSADSGGYSQQTGPYFTTPMFFNADVSALPKSPSSDSMIAALVSEGGWGNGNTMQVDFSIEVLTANASTPLQTFTPTS